VAADLLAALASAGQLPVQCPCLVVWLSSCNCGDSWVVHASCRCRWGARVCIHIDVAPVQSETVVFYLRFLFLCTPQFYRKSALYTVRPHVLISLRNPCRARPAQRLASSSLSAVCIGRPNVLHRLNPSVLSVVSRPG
jgi:hypothetical protein